MNIRHLELLATIVVEAAGSTPKLLKKQFPDNVKEIEELATHDPSGQKYAYLEWMWKQVRNGASVDEVSEKITTFHAIAEEFKIPFKAKDLKELDKIIDENQDKLIEVRTKWEHEQNKDKEPVELYSKDGYKALEVFQHNDVCQLGKGTTWCVSLRNANFFRSYNTPGTRWIFMTSPNGERRMAMIRQKHDQSNEDAVIEQLRNEKQTDGKDVGPKDWGRKILDEMGFSAWYGIDVGDYAKILELLKTPRGKKWLLTERGGYWLVLTKPGEAWLASQEGQAWFKSEDGGKKWLLTNWGGHWLFNNEPGKIFFKSPEWQAWFKSEYGKKWLLTNAGGYWLTEQTAGEVWLLSEEGRNWLNSKYGKKWLLGDAGGNWLENIDSGVDWLASPDGQAWFNSEDGGKEWLLSYWGADWLFNKKEGYDWFLSREGQAWFNSPDGKKWLNEEGGSDWLEQSEDGLAWLRSAEGQSWLQSPDGQSWSKKNPKRVKLIKAQAYGKALSAGIVKRLASFLIKDIG